MKKILILALSLILVLSVAACGGGNAGLVGTWKLVDTETETEYGMGLEFKKDGTMSYGLTDDMFSEAGSDVSTEEWSDALESLSGLMEIKYKVKSDTEIEIEVSAFMGLASEKGTVEYSLNGDTLVFDGATYTRVK